jgi:8-oxo-dGTP diphosphatase
MFKKYSLGFIFTPSFDKVLLIHKVTPDWQKGNLNGIGGKIEEDESTLSCVVREVKEESNLSIPENYWVYVANLSSNNFFTDVFACKYDGQMTDAKSLEVEQIEWFSTRELPSNMMNNLYWLIPLSIDKLQHNEPKTLVATY